MNKITVSRAQDTTRLSYDRPELMKHDNLKAITFECPQWQCSVVVPAPPTP